MAPTYGYGLSHQFGNRDPLLPNRIPVRLAVGGGRQAYLPETRLYQEMAPSQSSGALLGQNCHFSDMPTNRGAWAGTVRPETPPEFPQQGFAARSASSGQASVRGCEFGPRCDADLSQHTYPNTSDDIIRRFKWHHPKLKVLAAFDPCRQGFRDEFDAVARKVDAAADGFFTQPIFDLRLLEVCAEMLRGHNVFWVIARLWDRVHELTGRRRTK